MDPSAEAIWQPTGPLTGSLPVQPTPDAFAFCIHTSGRRFHVTFDLASVFMRHAHRVIDEGRAGLVPLLHEDGFDMLFVSPQTPLEIHDLRDPCAVTTHGGASVRPSDGTTNGPGRNP